VIDEGDGKLKLSAIPENSNEIQITEYQKEQVKPIFVAKLDLKEGFGRSIDRGVLFKAIISLYSKGKDSPKDFTSSKFLLLLLLRIGVEICSDL
jgi:hypothetical protein